MVIGKVKDEDLEKVNLVTTAVENALIFSSI
jgi:hypothetical protein